MSVITGADADALDAAADQLTAAADELDRSAAGLASTLGALRWIGSVAVRFSDLWSSQHNPRMSKNSVFLRDAAATLHRDAAEQRAAAGADGGSGWTPQGFAGGVGRAAELAVRQRAIADALAAEIQRVRQLSEAEQLAWWNSLTDEQRLALLATRPGELTALHGLPPDVLATAQENYTSRIAGEIETSSASIHGEVEVKILWVRAGAGFDVEQRTFQNGTVELDLSGYLKAGAGAGDAEALAKAGMGGTFEFDSQAEADQFLKDLAIAAVKGDVLGFLGKMGSHLGSVTGTAGVEAGAKVDAGAAGASVGVDANVSVSVDTRGDDRGEVTLSANASISGSSHAGVLGVSGEMKIEASVVLDGTTPKEISFKMEYQNAALAGQFAGVAEVSSGVTHSGTAEVTFDLTQPEVRDAAALATAALQRGDVVGASRALAGVMDRAQIVVQQAVGSQSTVGFDAKVVEGKLTTNASVATSTFVKPPGGSFYEVN